MLAIRKFLIYFGIGVFITLLQLPKTRTTSDADSCYSFAGGSVYPAGSSKGDHQLQYTKAVSEFASKNILQNIGY